MTPLFKGKVREIYDVSDKHLVIVTTDRISAFDNILPIQIKNKGVVLNRISNFWFDKTKNIISNHIIETDVNNMPSFFHDDFYRDRTVMVKKLNMIPIEFVVRGYSAVCGRLIKMVIASAVICFQIIIYRRKS